VTLVHCSLRLIGENVEDERMVVKDITEPMKMLKKCGIWCIRIDV
jgi:hypothetical protein